MFNNVAFRFLSSQSLVGIIPFLMLPIYTNKFSPEEYGAYGLSIVVISIFSGIGNMGLSVIFERNFHEYKLENERINYLFSIVSFVSLILIIIWGICFFLLGNIISILKLEELDNKLVSIGMMALFLKSIQDYFLLFFKHNREFKKYIRLKYIEVIGSNIFSVILIFLYDFRIVSLFFGLIIVSSINVVWATLSLNSRMKAQSFEFINLFPSIRLSLPLTPRIFFGVINTKFDKYLLGILNNISGVGVYEISQKIGNVVFLIQTSLENVFGPTVYSKMFKNKKGVISLSDYLTPFFYVTTGFAFLISLFSQEIFTFLFPKEYSSGVKVTMIFCLLYSTYFFGKIPQLLYAKKTYLISIITLLNVLLNIILNLILIPNYGIEGAAVATFISGIVTGGASFYYSQKYTPIDWNYGQLFLIMFYFFLSILLIFYIDSISLHFYYIILIKLLLIAGYFLFKVIYKINLELNY